MMSIWSLDAEHTSTTDMLHAIKPYANTKEQDLIDFLSKMIQIYKTKDNRKNLSMEQIFSILPPEQQSRLETLQMVMQVINQS